MATTTLTSALSAEYLTALKEAQAKEKALKEQQEKEKAKERPPTDEKPDSDKPKPTRTTTTTKAPKTKGTTTLPPMESEMTTDEHDYSGDDYSGDDYSGDDDETKRDDKPSKNSPPKPRPTKEPTMTTPTVNPAKEMMAKMAAQARKVEMEMMLDVYDLAASAVINNLGNMIEMVEPVLVTVHETVSRWPRWSNQALNNVMRMFNWTWWPLFSMIFK